MQALAAGAKWEKSRQRAFIHMRNRVEQLAEISANHHLRGHLLREVGEIRERSDLLQVTKTLDIRRHQRPFDGKSNGIPRRVRFFSSGFSSSSAAVDCATISPNGLSNAAVSSRMSITG